MSAQKIAPRQFLVYVAGGVICALIDVGLLWWLLRVGVPPLTATTAGFLAGLAVNYAFYTRITFDSPFTPSAFARFMAVVLLNYLLTVATVTLSIFATEHALAAVIGKVVALPLVALNGYWMSKHWVFK
jgi:putative flippase GtrA